LVLAAPAPAGSRPDPKDLAAAIDRHVARKLQENNVSPAPACDDATFFRRINLALAGRVPVTADVRAFLADADPDKRAKAVEKLLASPAFANFQTATWRNWLLPEAQTVPEVANTVPAFEAWLRNRIRHDEPYDRFVSELLAAPLDGTRAGRRAEADDDPDAANGPVAFFTAKEGKPENLAAATARLFLGVRLECAQCHDHPFAKWTRDQFWGLAAFYGGVTRSGGTLREVFDRRELPVPNRDRAVSATFLDGKEPEWRFKKSPRVTLAAWVTSAENPFFARAAVNRLWALMFGVGIIDPVDDAHEKNPPSHPELLDELARAFVDSGFDTKFILRAICRSATFGRSSSADGPGQRDVRLFARFPVQGLTPEQLYDSLQVVAGNPPDGSGGNYLQAAGTPRRQFMETFALSGSKTDTQTTIIQALALMNGDLVGSATGLESSRTLGAVVELPGLTPAERIEALYLAALGRPPRAEEVRRSLKYVEADDGAAAKTRYADVLWALLNGVEFRTNH
jgi:hypothetical protein